MHSSNDINSSNMYSWTHCCRAPEYGIRVGPEYAGGVISLLQQLQSSAAEESDARASHYLPAHFLHVPRGLQQILSLPEFHASHLQVDLPTSL